MLLSACMLMCGMIFFAYMHDIIIINLFYYKPRVISCGQSHKKIVTITYYGPMGSVQEKKEIIWSNNKIDNVQYLVTSWLTLLEQENIVSKKISLQSCALSVSEQDAFISFDRSFFAKQSSVRDKLMLIESLLQTIRDNEINLQGIYFLSHHQPLNDKHLDFSKPWPLTGFVSAPYQAQPITPLDNKKQYTIVLAPAGDAKNTERVVYNNFECALTLQYAQELKTALTEMMPYSTVIITRHAGDIVEPLYNAALANRLQADLYISLHAFQEKELLSSLGLYYVMYNPVTDLWHKKSTKLECTPYTMAYLDNLVITQSYAFFLEKSLLSEQKKYGFATKKTVGMPFKPLLGVHVPAVALEIGVTEKQNIIAHVMPVATAINALLEKINL
ncbi:MAG: N-acetylmuramoyl-L-alanine amidase [Candidatus Babeliaceae bacterium]